MRSVASARQDLQQTVDVGLRVVEVEGGAQVAGAVGDLDARRGQLGLTMTESGHRDDRGAGRGDGFVSERGESGAEAVGEGQVVGADRLDADLLDQFEGASRRRRSRTGRGLRSNRRAERASSATGP